MMQIRLNKYLSDSGVTSRRKSEELIKEGRVTVNRKVITELAFKVDPGSDTVTLDGEKVFPRRHVYLLLNKPRGVVTTTADEKNRKTVVDLIKSKERIYPVGRLDYNTTGVLFLTNDGDFSNLLTHPKNKVPRVYEVKLNRILEEEDEKTLLKGVYINGVKGKFISISFPKRQKIFIEVASVEGRNHFVKNMFGALGYTVTALNRKSYAGIHADIPPGAYRALSKSEINDIINTYGK
ncbi:MAG: pseudouridine synthase [Ignavibacteriaceae bacterium]